MTSVQRVKGIPLRGSAGPLLSSTALVSSIPGGALEDEVASSCRVLVGSSVALSCRDQEL